MNLPFRSTAKHLKHGTATAILCSMLLALPACRIPKLRRPEPGPVLPAGFTGLPNGGVPDYDAAKSPEDLPQPRVLPPEAPGADNAARPPEQPPKPGAANPDAPCPENSAQLGIEEFYNDPVLTNLIHMALAGNQELRILDQEVQIASNEVLARRGTYLPFITFGASGGMDKPSLYTPLGAAENQLTWPTGNHFPDPLPNTQLGLNLFWQLDIWRELRNARDAAEQRYVAATERRNYFVTRLVAEIADNYYGLMALDKRMENLDNIILLQEQSLKLAEARKAAARGTQLAVQRFDAEVRRNQSDKLIVRQDIIEVENRINFLLGRFPQPVERRNVDFINLTVRPLSLGIPAQLLQNRPDIREAERALAATGLDILVARAHFFPRVDITAGVGYQAFSPKYLLVTPEALIANAAGNLVVPLINKRAIQAEYMSANARQLEAVYNYQRVILNAFTEVINRVSMVENYRISIEIKKRQVKSLEGSVVSASNLFQAARVEYMDVLFSQRDLWEARRVLIDTKRQQLTAIVNAYQALGGGNLLAGAAPGAGPNGQSVQCHR